MWEGTKKGFKTVVTQRMSGGGRAWARGDAKVRFGRGGGKKSCEKKSGPPFGVGCQNVGTPGRKGGKKRLYGNLAQGITEEQGRTGHVVKT